MSDRQQILMMHQEMPKETQKQAQLPPVDSKPRGYLENETTAINPQRLSIIAITLSGIALIITLSFVLSQVFVRQAPLRVVDMGKLLNEQAIRLAKGYANGNVPQSVMQGAVDRLKEQLEAYGLENKVILLAKGAVLSGDLVNVTQQIKASIAGDPHDQSNNDENLFNEQIAPHKRSRP